MFQPNREFRSAKFGLSLTLVALWLSGCTGSSSGGASIGCGEGPICPSGEICLADTCRRLCTVSSDCAEDEYCGSGVCILSPGEPPTIESVDGTGLRDLDETHGRYHVRDRLVINGANLLGATVTLAMGGQTWTLESCEQETSSRLAMALPAPLVPGSYALTVTNQAGACSANLSLLQGEPGAVNISDLSGRDLILYINDSTNADPSLVINGTLHGSVSSIALSAHPSVASSRSILFNGDEVVTSNRAGLFVGVFDLVTHDRVGVVGGTSVEASFDVSVSGERLTLLALLSNLSATHVVMLASTGDVSPLKFDTALVAALKQLGASRVIDELAATDSYVFVGMPGLGEANGIEQIGTAARGMLASLSTIAIESGVVGFHRRDFVGNYAGSATRGGPASDLNCVGCVAANEIAGGAIGTSHLASESVDAARIADGSVGTAELADAAVTGAKIAGGTITGLEIANGAVGNFDLADNAVTSGKVADNAITNAKLADNAVGTAEIAAGAVTGAKIAGSTITGLEIADGGVGNLDLADNAVDSAKIASGAVTAAKIAAATITSQEIATGGVATVDLADGAVNSAKIANASIALEDLSTMCVEGQVLERGASGWVCGTDNGASYTEGAGITISGVTIAASLGTSVSGAELDDAAVSTAKLAPELLFNGANLVPNPYFMRQTAGLPAHWSLNYVSASAPVAATLEDVSTTAVAGPWALRNGGNTRADLISSAFIPINQNFDYVVEGVFIDTNTGGMAGKIILGVQLFRGNGTPITSGSESTWWLEVANGVPGTTWTRYSGSFGASTARPFPTDARTMKVSVMLNKDGGVGGNKFFMVQGLRVTEDADNDTLYSAGTGISINGSNAISSTLGTTIETAEITDSNVTLAKMADNAVGNAEMLDDAIGTAELANGSILFADMSANSCTANQVMKRNSGNTAWVCAADEDVPYTQSTGIVISSNAISSTLGVSIETAEITDSNVTLAKMADDSVGSTEIVNGSILFADMNANTCTANQVMKRNAGNTAWVCAVDEDTPSSLGASIETAEITDSNVTLAKMADDSVGSTEIVNGSILFADMNANTCTANQVMKRNTGNTAWVCAADEDVPYTQSTGIVITSNAISSTLGVSIETAEITDSNVTLAKMADNAIGNAEMLDNAVGNAEMADNAIGNAEMLDNAVGNAEMADSAVGTAEVADASILFADVAANGCTANQSLRRNAGNTAWICAPAVGLYSLVAGCGATSTLTLSSTCTTACGGANEYGCYCYNNCSGTCNQGAPISCATTFQGYLH